MKPYFVKSLPQGREIKGIRELFDKNNPFHKAGFDYLDAIEERKLFLCSRDIQVGDNFDYKGLKGKLIKDDGKNITTEWKDGKITIDNAVNLQLSFKVIGEISPKATWVKEGDEFDETQVLLMYKDDDNPTTDLIAFIKGPCGHFH